MRQSSFDDGRSPCRRGTLDAIPMENGDIDAIDDPTVPGGQITIRDVVMDSLVPKVIRLELKS